MKKQIQLIRVLMKCGKVGKAEAKNSAVGDTGTLVSLVISIAMIVAMFMGGQYAAQHTDMLGDASTIFTAVMTISGMAAFFLTLLNAVNQLYISSDLDVLVTLPFTPMQIVVAKLASISIVPASVCFGLNVPAAVGYFTKAEGLSPMFIPAMIIGALAMTVYVLSLVAILLMIIMRTFKFVRSRNVISVLTSLMAFGVTMAYISFNSSSSQLDEQQALNIVRMLSSMSASMSIGFPTVRFAVNGASGDVISLILALAVAAAAFALLMVCAKYLYFSAALGMTDANGTRGPINAKEMSKYTAKTGISRTLMQREIRHILRTPAMITNGYLYSLIVPFVMVIPMFVKMVDPVKEMLIQMDLPPSIDSIRQVIEVFHISDSIFLIGGSAIGLFICSLAVALSTLSRYPISREGKDFSVLRAMPIPPHTLVLVKRRVAALFNGISGWFLPALILIVAGAMRLIPLWCAALCAVTNLGWLITLIDICMLFDINKPNLNWENEADVTKNNIIGVFELIIVTVVMVGGAIMFTEGIIKFQNADTIIGCVLIAMPVVLAIVFELILRKTADKLY